MDSQVRRCPGFGGEKGNTGALCADTEDHPISFRRQTSRSRCTEAQVRRSIKVAVSQKVQGIAFFSTLYPNTVFKLGCRIDTGQHLDWNCVCIISLNSIFPLFVFHSMAVKLRPRRAPQRGCQLGTCQLHNLANTLYHIGQTNGKDESKTAHDPQGYGR